MAHVCGQTVRGEPSRLFLDRARAYRALGQAALSSADFSSALAELESQVRSVGDSESKARFVREIARPVFDQAISFEADRQADSRLALELAESSRLAASLGLGAGNNGWGLNSHQPGADLEFLSHRLPPSALLVHYHVLKDRLLIWTLDRSEARQEVVAIPSRALAKEILDLQRLATRSDRVKEMLVKAARVFDIVLGPVRDRLRGATTLLLVPDGPLEGLPFALLRDSRTDRYLVEDHEIVYGPSMAALLRRTTAAARRDKTVSPRVLVIADPAMESHLLGLPRLPGARKEAEVIAALYPGATVLTGMAATPERVLREAETGEFQVIHFAGHAVSNPTSALMSYLALAPDAGPGTGELFARNLAAAPLSGVRLAVLAACRSSEPDDEGGISNLARALLAAGVRDVVGSFWSIEDQTTEAFFERFYEELRRGMDPARALRRAQLQMLTSGDPRLERPSTWAGFSLLGSIL